MPGMRQPQDFLSTTQGLVNRLHEGRMPSPLAPGYPQSGCRIPDSRTRRVSELQGRCDIKSLRAITALLAATIVAGCSTSPAVNLRQDDLDVATDSSAVATDQLALQPYLAPSMPWTSLVSRRTPLRVSPRERDSSDVS